MWLIAMPGAAALDWRPRRHYRADRTGDCAFGLTMETLADIQRTVSSNRKTGRPSDRWLVVGTRTQTISAMRCFGGVSGLPRLRRTPEVIWTIYAPALMNFLIVNFGCRVLEHLIKKPGCLRIYGTHQPVVPRIFPRTLLKRALQHPHNA